MVEQTETPADARAHQRDVENKAISEVWRAYKENPTPKLLKTLMEHYSWLPYFHAKDFMRKLPSPAIDLDDLLQAGRFAMLKAIERYDPDQGTKFQSFATLAVWGAIVDEINKVDWTPRKMREQLRDFIRQLDAQGISLDETNDSQLSELLGITIDEAASLRSAKNRSFIIPVDISASQDIAYMEDLEASAQEERSVVRMSIQEDLNDLERQYINMRYSEGYKLSEIAKELGLSPRKLNLVKDSALEKLRVALG